MLPDKHAWLQNRQKERNLLILFTQEEVVLYLLICIRMNGFNASGSYYTVIIHTILLLITSKCKMQRLFLLSG